MIAVLPKLVVVPSVTRQIRVELQREFETAEVEVRLQAPWGWELLFGRLPGLGITMHNAVAEHLNLAKVEVRGEQIRFERSAFWKDRQLNYEGAQKLESLVTVTEEDLNTYFWQEVDPNRSLHLVIQPTGVSLNGQLAFWNTEWDFALQGLLEIWQQSNLRFVPQNLEVQATRVPPFLLEVLNENYDFVLDFSIFPYPITISDVQMEDGQIIVKFGVIP